MFGTRVGLQAREVMVLLLLVVTALSACEFRERPGSVPATAHGAPFDHNRSVLLDKMNQVWAMRPDGTDAVSLTSQREGFSGRAAWSPDGTLIAFTCEDGSFSNRICLAGPDDGWRYLTRTTGGGDPDWSPDGSRIVYVDNSSTDGGLRTISADGGQERFLTNDHGLYPAWGPNRIAYVAELDGQPGILAIDPDSGAKEMLVELDSLSNANPAWSQDGTRIAFNVGARGTAFIMVSNADGSDVRRLGPGTDPVWSPNGSRILFSRAGEVFTISLQDSSKRRLGQQGVASDWLNMGEES
jgi:Tol biopolymer transport system component